MIKAKKIKNETFKKKSFAKWLFLCKKWLSASERAHSVLIKCVADLSEMKENAFRDGLKIILKWLIIIWRISIFNRLRNLKYWSRGHFSTHFDQHKSIPSSAEAPISISSKMGVPLTFLDTSVLEILQFYHSKLREIHFNSCWPLC